MKINNIAFYLLIALCLYLSFLLFLKNREIIFLESKNAVLPANIKSQIIIKDRSVSYKYKKPSAASYKASPEAELSGVPEDKASPSAAETKPQGVIVSERYYLPPEGFLKIEQSSLDNSLSVEISDKGFTLNPFVGAALNIDGKASYLGGLRLLYFRRYGLGGAFNSEYKFTLVADRRLDDILPLFQNTSAALHIGKNYAALGFNVYL